MILAERQDTTFYKFWLEHGRTLEDLVGNKETILKEARAFVPDQAGYVLLETLTESLLLGKLISGNYGHYLGPTQREIIQESKSIIGKVSEIIQPRIFSSQHLEKKLDGLVRQWTAEKNKGPQEKLLMTIAAGCRHYKIMSLFEQHQEKKQERRKATLSASPFYADFCSLSFIADENLARKYLQDYAERSTCADLQRFAEEFGDTFIQKVSQERSALRQQYLYRFSPRKPEYALIEAMPITPFRHLQRDLQMVLTEPEKYLAVKREIEKEKKGVAGKVHQLQQVPQALDNNGLQRLVSLQYQPKNFPSHDSLYLRENVKSYLERAVTYTTLILQKRKEAEILLVGQVEAIGREMERGLEGQQNKIIYLQEKQEAVQGIRKKLFLLGINNHSAFSQVDDKISRFRQYYQQGSTALPPGQASGFSGSNVAMPQPPLPVQRYACSGEIPVKKEQNTIPSLVVSPILEASPLFNMPPIKSEQDFFLLAHEWRNKVQDKQLSRFCSAIAAKDEFAGLLGMKERLRKVRELDVPALRAGLQGADQQLYQRLQEGITIFSGNYLGG